MSNVLNLFLNKFPLMSKQLLMWVTIPLDLSTWSFIPIPRFFHSRRHSDPPLLTPVPSLFSSTLTKTVIMCLLLIDKERAKDKTYI
jgi:hypothetical protein